MKKIFLLALLSALPAWAIDLNTATVDEIAALKGMTPQTAEAIVAARTQFGPFKTSADVLKVSGVTQGILNQNRATLTIAGKPVTTRSGTAPAIPGVRPAIPAKKATTTTTTTATKSGKSTSGKSQTVLTGQDDNGNKGGGGRGNNGGNSGGHGGGNGSGGGSGNGGGGGGGNK